MFIHLGVMACVVILGSNGDDPAPPDVTNHRNLKLLEKVCGRITDSRIIGGGRTSVAEFPWMALIGYKINGTGPRFACGGTLINKRNILTAAHCVHRLQDGVEPSVIRIGEHDIGTKIDCDEVEGKSTYCADEYQEYSIEKLYVHSGYQPDKGHNDIALIRMTADADLRPLNVMPICLPIGNAATLRPKKGIITGWGATEANVRSQKLLKARVDVIPADQCATAYLASKNRNITYKQLCAGGKDLRTSCAGDSGGPLQHPFGTSDTPRYFQYGIVSFGLQSCKVDELPGVYTRVVHFVDWILDMIEK